MIPISKIRANQVGCDDWVPFPYNFNPKNYNENLQIEKVVMINSAKFSANKNSLYGLRREISGQFHLLDIGYKLIGDNWHMKKTKELRERIWAVRKEVSAGNLPDFKEAFSKFFYRYPEYCGRVDDKFVELSKYKYALIIENEADYISEKLFDAISAGCVPVYIGYDLSTFKKIALCTIEIEPNVDKIIDFFNADNTSLYKEKKIMLITIKIIWMKFKLFHLKTVLIKLVRS